MKGSFVLYTEYAAHLELLTMEQRGVLLTAVFAHETGANLPEMDAAVSMAYSFIAAQLERDAEKYQSTVAKRSAAGKASGERRRQAIASALVEQKGTKRTSVELVQQNGANATDNVYVYDNDNDKHKNLRARYAEDDALNKAIYDFIDNRKKIRKPMTDRAIELFVKKLDSPELGANTVEDKVRLIETAIERGWQSVYPDKNPQDKRTRPKPLNWGFEQREVTDADEQALLRLSMG